jgi:hypothetical protein
MTVRELIEALQAVDPDMLVVLQEDAEGNGYSPLAGAEPALYVARSTWSGEVYSQNDLEEYGQPEGGQTAMILWPVN